MSAINYTSDQKNIRDLYHRALSDGGATFLISSFDRSVTEPTTGFVVGGTGPSVVVSLNGLSREDLDTLSYWIVRGLSKSEARGFGSWKDDKGRVWFDRVDILDSRDAALDLAALRGEIAIYDLKNQREITV